MKKLLMLATVVCAIALAGMAYAQAEPGDLGVFFSATPTTGADAVRNGTVAFAPFNMYVISFDVGSEAFEFGLQLPAGLIVSGGRSTCPTCTDFGAGDDNWIVGTGGVCWGAAAGPTVLATYAGALFLAPPANDATICLIGAVPSSFPNGLPGYLVCDAPGLLRNYGAAYEGCAIINRVALPEPVPADATSFGALKAAY